MLKELVILLACSTLTFGMPVLSSYWYAPRTHFVPYTPLVQPPSTTTLFANAPTPRSAETARAETPAEDNPPADNPPPPEFVMPTTGAGWVDFVFAHMLLGVGDEEAGLIRSVLTPQYDRFAQIVTPAPAPAPAEPSPEGVVLATVTISSAPLALTTPTRRGTVAAANEVVFASAENPTLQLLVQAAPAVSVPTPEPATLALVGLGIMGMWLGRRR